MAKEYPEIEEKQQMLAEPDTAIRSYGNCAAPLAGLSIRDKVIAGAMGSGSELTIEEVYGDIELSVKQRRKPKKDLLLSQEHAIDLETMRRRLHQMVHDVYQRHE